MVNAALTADLPSARGMLGSEPARRQQWHHGQNRSTGAIAFGA